MGSMQWSISMAFVQPLLQYGGFYLAVLILPFDLKYFIFLVYNVNKNDCLFIYQTFLYLAISR